MGYIIKMPQMGMSMDKGVVVEWTIDEGEEIKEDDIVVIIESEKASHELEAREDGVLQEILVSEEETAQPGTPIGLLAGSNEDLQQYREQLDEKLNDEDENNSSESLSTQTSNESSAETEANEKSSSKADVKASPGAVKLADEKGIDLADVTGSGPGGVIVQNDIEEYSEEEDEEDESDISVKASPGARRLAKENDVRLTSITGSGPGDVIVEEDVTSYIQSLKDQQETDTTGTTCTVLESSELTGIQQTISDRLSASADEAVHVTLNRSFDTTEIQAIRETLTVLQTDSSIVDFILKAVARALREHPEFNAHFENGEHKLIKEVNIGYAVDYGDGLVTPVIGGVDQKDLTTINAERTDLTERVAEGQYSMDDLQGGTITISNLGVFGIDSFNPIINPPEIAILGIGRIRDDESMTLSLSFDHRIVNGADAAKFLDKIVSLLTSKKSMAAFINSP